MEPTELILLEGTVSAVIYRNEENGYTIPVSYTHLTLPTICSV